MVNSGLDRWCMGLDRYIFREEEERKEKEGGGEREGESRVVSFHSRFPEGRV